MMVYLAGGMHNDWREQVKRDAPGHTYVDPMKSGLINPTEQEYTTWDLDRLYDSHLILVYMDPGNPSGFGLNFEAGFAEGQGIRIWFVNELKETDHRWKYFGMLRAVASRNFDNLSEAIRELENATLSKVY